MIFLIFSACGLTITSPNVDAEGKRKTVSLLLKVERSMTFGV
jgi:hypothetical protein